MELLYQQQLLLVVIKKNNLENLNRVKRGNENVLRTKAKFLGHNWLYAKISNNTWANVQFLHNNNSESKFRNQLYLVLSLFPKSNESYAGGEEWDEMSGTDISTIVTKIKDNFNNIDNVYKNKNNSNLGIIIRTNSDGYWMDNDQEVFWGAHVNNFDDSKNGITYSDRGKW